MRPKIYSKADILRAMRHTRSNRAAARYLGCSYQHYKRYAKLYTDEETGKTLFEIHLNPSGKGVSKFIKGRKKEPAIVEIMEGRLSAAHFSSEKIKNKLIQESILAEECHKCGFHERRVMDYKIPLLLSFKDGNKKHYARENLELLCYNCYFLHIGNVFTPEEEAKIQDAPNDKFKVETPTFDLSEEHIKNMKALGLM